MDAKAAYNQVPVAKECQKHMVLVVLDEDNNKRFYAPLRANFGSMNMPGFFQRLSGDLFNTTLIRRTEQGITKKKKRWSH